MHANKRLLMKDAATTRRRGCKDGFTLIEVMIVLVILAIIAGLAIPRFARTFERTYWDSSGQVLRAIYHGERAYFFTNNTYFVPVNTTASWRQISMDNPNGNGAVAYAVAAGSTGLIATSFTATATRVGGACNGSTITINDQGTFTPDPTVTLCWCGSC